MSRIEYLRVPHVARRSQVEHHLLKTSFFLLLKSMKNCSTWYYTSYKNSVVLTYLLY